MLVCTQQLSRFCLKSILTTIDMKEVIKKQIENLMDLLDISKSKYKTQEEWWNSEEFNLIEILDEAYSTICELE
jgi:hypothetical protein